MLKNNMGRLLISIHALRMERDRHQKGGAYSAQISIHALRMERDRLIASISNPVLNFNPRAPHGARPLGIYGLTLEFMISIHALRMERDREARG